MSSGNQLLFQESDHDWVLSRPKSAFKPQACILKRIPGSSSSDFHRLSDWLLTNPQHYLRLLGRQPNLRDAFDLFTVCPSGVGLNRKSVWGMSYEQRYVACLEVLRSWPQRDILFIGFLLVDEHLRRRGLASRCLSLLAESTHHWEGIRRWQLAVVETHVDSMRFWTHAGFIATGRSELSAACGARLVILEKLVR